MNLNLRQFIDEHAPGLVKVVRPIAYEAPPGYPKLRDISYRLCLPIITMALYAKDEEQPPASSELVDAYMSVMKAAQLSMPTFYATNECLQELLVRSLPSAIALSDIPWTFEAMLFVLPEGFLISPTEGDCPFLVISKFAAMEAVSVNGSDVPPMARNQDGFCVFTCPIAKEDPPLITARVAFDTHPTTDDIRSTSMGEFTHTSLVPEIVPDERLKGAESEFADFLIEIALKLVVHLDVHRDRIQAGKLIRDGQLPVRSANIVT